MSLDRATTRLVLLDIEGTTTPIPFVYDVLFPFARTHLRGWLSRNWGSDQANDVLRALSREHAHEAQVSGLPAAPRDADSAANYALWLMDADRKAFGLKLLQGFVCEEGYRAGRLHGEVYDDVPRALRRWRGAGIDVAIYSSGSERAQRLLFASVAHGDLTPLLVGFFDTSVGAKGDADSYRRIADALNHPPGQSLFLSDVTRELAAARDAGYDVRLLCRPGNPPQPDADSYQQIRSFDEL